MLAVSFDTNLVLVHGALKNLSSAAPGNGLKDR
jgi:hypothetical protein